MATTKNGIYYPNDGTQAADILSDMKKMAESIDENIQDNKYDDTAVNDNIKKLNNAITEQNESIEANSIAIETNVNNIEKNRTECERIVNQLNSKVVAGTEITLNDSADLKLKKFDIDVTNNVNLVVSNKNLLEFTYHTGNGITFDKNRITIINPTGYLYAGNTLVGGNKLLSGKKVIFTTITNGTITSGTLDFTVHTNKTQYRFQKKYTHTVEVYSNDIKAEAWKFADDEYITSIFVYTTGATCNLTIDVQISIINAEFTEHQGAEYQITSSNKEEIIKQIIENGTYKNITHFYTTEETHANMSLEYYQNLDILLNKYKEQIPQGQATGTEITLNDSANLNLTSFEIDVSDVSHLVLSNKNILFFNRISGNGIAFDKNRVTIINPTGYFYSANNLNGNEFLKGKTLMFSLIANGEFTGEGMLQFIIHSNKKQYILSKTYAKDTYNNDVFTHKIILDNDETIASIQVWTAGTNCNLTIDVQAEISDEATDFIEHEGAEFAIASTNVIAIIEQIKKNGTYKNITHFYTTDETHANIKLEYYKDLETLFNNLVQANVQAESEVSK